MPLKTPQGKFQYKDICVMMSCSFIKNSFVLRLQGSEVGLTQLAIDLAGNGMGTAENIAPHEEMECLRVARHHLENYLAGQPYDFSEIPLDLTALSPFRQLVLNHIRAHLGHGKIMSYSELAAKVGRPGGARAIGSVMATNPLPIIIPCHRVVGARGKLGGYSGGEGLATKIYLLNQLEGHSF
jgi:O-6-methylguanine DNA methyltransferase